MKTQRVRDIAIAIGLTLLVLLLYRKVQRLWWTYDDAFNLHLAIDHTVRDAFFSAAVWPQKLFTPLMMAAVEGNLALFGLDPARWFVVHLAVVVLSVLALYAALRLWFRPPAAATGALLYAASVPLCSLVTEISGIHYFLGIGLGSLAAILFVRARPLLSAFVYLAAMLAKETIIPLPFLLLALPVRDVRTRLRQLIPHAVSLAVYLLWRRAVIGTILGGYGWAVDRDDWPRLIAMLPQKIVLACAGANVWLGVSLIALMLLGIVRIGKRGALLFLLALALAVGPIVPVSKEMQRRYALMPWLCWSIAFVAGAERWRRREVRAALLTVVPLLMIVVNRQEWGREYGRTLRMSEEARFFYDMPPNSWLRRPIVPPAAMEELNWLKTAHAHKAAGAAWFYDDYFLCTADIGGKRAWEYYPHRRAIVDITSDLPAIAKRHCRGIRNDAPLSADFEYRDSALFWKFGPYAEGQYRVLIANGIQAFDVPREDGFRLPDMPGITLRIRYDSPEGWTTYSPDLALDFARRPRMTWSRSAVAKPPL